MPRYDLEEDEYERETGRISRRRQDTPSPSPLRRGRGRCRDSSPKEPARKHQPLKISSGKEKKVTKAVRDDNYPRDLRGPQRPSLGLPAEPRTTTRSHQRTTSSGAPSPIDTSPSCSTRGREIKLQDRPGLARADAVHERLSRSRDSGSSISHSDYDHYQKHYKSSELTAKLQVDEKLRGKNVWDATPRQTNDNAIAYRDRRGAAIDVRDYAKDADHTQKVSKFDPRHGKWPKGTDYRMYDK